MSGNRKVTCPVCGVNECLSRSKMCISCSNLERNRFTLTREAAIDAIQRKARELGRTPRHSDFDTGTSADYPSASQITKRFGWADTVEAAGFPRPLPGGNIGRETATRRNGYDRPFPISGTEAATYGAIVTFENDDGDRLVLHRVGANRRAIKHACQDALNLDSSFKVVSISTPQSVYRDMQGDRLNHKARDYPDMPEVQAVPREMLYVSFRAAL